MTATGEETEPEVDLPQAFACGLELRGRTAVIVPVGELDIETALAFDQRVAEALNADVDRVRVDLSQLQFIDSTGLNALAKFHKQAADVGRELEFSRPTESIRRILAVVGLDRVFRLTDQPPTARCENCDTELPRAARWCPRCRTALS